MAEKARLNKVKFIPHFKTHQSKEVGEWFKEYGVEAITVSSLSMARYFADSGWNNITVAFPINILQIEEIDELAQSVELTLLVLDVKGVDSLSTLKNKVTIMVEIDAGYHRSGVEVNDVDSIKDIIDKIVSSKHQFKGFYCHSGNSYYSKGKEEILQLYNNVTPQLLQLKEHFNIYKPTLSIGDTPTCSVMESFEGVDSIHPGNFIYYDVMQTAIGSCTSKQIAVAVECPVVMKDEHRNELVIYGGGVHLSKESIEYNGHNMFGLVALTKDEQGWVPLENTFVKSLSQEHGIISTTSEIISKLDTGDTVFILPVHSCMAVDCMQEGFTLLNKKLAQIHKF